MTAYPWDLLDEGVDDVVDYLHGELGVEGLAVWAAGPACNQLRVRPVEPRLIQSDGGFLFRPSEEAYGATRCKPIVSSMVKSRCPLEEIATACDNGGLRLRLLITAAKIGRMAKRQGEMACVNLYGAKSSDDLCLANPDVQALLVALVADLAGRYSPDSISIRDLAIRWDGALPADMGAMIEDHSPVRRLLSLCFCESCQQRASEQGVDVGQVRRLTSVFIDQAFRKGAGWARDEFANTIEKAEFVAYLRWRESELGTLLERIDSACGCPTLVECDHPAGSAGFGFHRLPAGSKGVAVKLATIDESNPLRGLPDNSRRKEITLSAGLLNDCAESEVVKFVAQAAENGCTGVRFDGFSCLTESALSSVRQAVRYARRTTFADRS